MRKALYVMGVLDETDVDWLGTNGRVEYLTPGSVVIQAGREPESLFILLDGRLEVVLDNGAKVATLLSGEIVGEISFVDARPPLASVVAGDGSHLLAIPRTLLREKLAEDTGFASRFYRALAIFLADRLRTTTARLGYGDPKQDAKNDADEISEELMEAVSLAAVRFDRLLKELRVNR